MLQCHTTAVHLSDRTDTIPCPWGCPKKKLFGQRDGNHEHSSTGRWTEKVTQAISDQHSCIPEQSMSATTSVSPDTPTPDMHQLIGGSYPAHKGTLLKDKVARKQVRAQACSSSIPLFASATPMGSGKGHAHSGMDINHSITPWFSFL